MSETEPGPLPTRAERVVGGTTVMELRGEIDILAAPLLGARLDSLSAAPHLDLVLDLRTVTFIDCTGLGLLCRVRNRVRAREGRLRLVVDSPFVLRTFHHARLAGVFEICSRLPEDLTAAPETSRATATG
jgi:anti-sigma B factor antagonist